MAFCIYLFFGRNHKANEFYYKLIFISLEAYIGLHNETIFLRGLGLLEIDTIKRKNTFRFDTLK